MLVPVISGAALLDIAGWLAPLVAFVVLFVVLLRYRQRHPLRPRARRRR